MGEAPGGGAPPLPSRVSLAVCGTGLAEACVAAAAAARVRAGAAGAGAGAGAVLHVDAAARYGGAWATLALDEAPAFCAEQNEGRGHYAAARVWRGEGEGAAGGLARPREYAVDACGPAALYCDGAAVEALVASGAHQYVEFKATEGVYVLARDGRALRRAPGSRADVFEDACLQVSEKRALTRLLMAAKAAAQGEPGAAARFCGREDLSKATFQDALSHNGVEGELADVLAYGVALLDGKSAGAAEALIALARYSRSVGRFGAGQGAFLVPRFGASELPQAFCRAAAVKGALYMLRTSVEAVAQAEGETPTLRLSSGESVQADAVLLDSASAARLVSSGGAGEAEAADSGPRVVGRLAAVLDGPVTPKGDAPGDKDIAVVVLPPNSGGVGNVHPVRGLQVGGATAQCPAGQCVLYLATRGDDVEDVEGEALEALLKTALEAVCGATKTPPRPLWTLFTMQRVHNDSSGGGGEGRLATGAQLGVDLGCEASLAAARDAWRQLAGAVGAEEGEDRRELFPADEGGEAGSDDDDLALLQEGLDDDLDLDGDF